MKFIFPFLVFLLSAFFCRAQDTLQGKIMVKKPVIRPYIKVEYELYLSKVMLSRRDVPVDNGVPGNMETQTIPVFDSAFYGPDLQRRFPLKTALLSRDYAMKLNYSYLPSDTPHIDTMVVRLWITKSGKVKWVDVDSTKEVQYSPLNKGDSTGTGFDALGGTVSTSKKFPPALAAQLLEISYSIDTWGKPGGYMTPKKLFKRPQFFAESYCCKMYVIVSSRPLTPAQKKSGAAYAPFDIPLNSPPVDEQQKNFLDTNMSLQK